jgi:hypothetical protein
MASTFNLNVFQRSLSFCAAALLTLSLLGGIDHLAQPQTAADQWASTPAAATRS